MQNKYTKNITKSTYCSLKLIRQAIDEGFIKELTLFHKLKYHYNNSVVYNYRSRMPEIAAVCRLSKQTLYNYLKVLKDRNLAFENASNLHLTSVKAVKMKLKDRRVTKINPNDNDDLTKIRYRLYAKVLERHFKSMSFNEAIKRFRAENNRHKGKPSESTGSVSFSLSVRNFSEVIGVSTKSATKIIHQMEEMGLLIVYPGQKIKISDQQISVKYTDSQPGYFFTTENGTFQQFGNRLVLTEFHGRIPKITARLYAACVKNADKDF